MSAASTATDLIDATTAKQIALRHAQVKDTEITDYSCETDSGNGVLNYEIEFACNGCEYEYEINAFTGAIMKFHKELDD